ncbi:uncharacterized protein B0T23DRAFT_4316 [Neurospora hispaniola]|uniref:Uncharacterized protein n=1 Tax=Neurospora hispaniola TaxID=588809 RepID=A0AAJ0MV51_9PEZI|nr:hypothetical protein B0T23DRAFT_4316 [Neurospora hispaniola]
MALVDMALWGLAGWILRGRVRSERPNLTEAGEGQGTGLESRRARGRLGRRRDGRQRQQQRDTLRLTGQGDDRVGFGHRATDSGYDRARASGGSSRRLCTQVVDYLGWGWKDSLFGLGGMSGSSVCKIKQVVMMFVLVVSLRSSSLLTATCKLPSCG